MSLRFGRAIAPFAVIAALAVPAWMMMRPATAPAAVQADDSNHGPVDPARELVITDPSVIASPLETTFDPAQPSGNSPQGAWSFGRLVHNMLPAVQRRSPEAASALVMDWLKTWETDQSPNPGVSPAKARNTMRSLVLE